MLFVIVVVVTMAASRVATMTTIALLQSGRRVDIVGLGRVYQGDVMENRPQDSLAEPHVPVVWGWGG